MEHHAKWFVFFVALSLLMFIGCSPKNELGRQPVTGSITLNDKPLDHGSILFAPDDRRSVSSGAEITDGVYTIAAHQGLLPGSYTVRVYSTDEAGSEVEPTLPGPGVKAQPERIPFEHNMKSQHKLQVVDGQAAVFDLDIVTK